MFAHKQETIDWDVYIHVNFRRSTHSLALPLRCTGTDTLTHTRSHSHAHARTHARKPNNTHVLLHSANTPRWRLNLGPTVFSVQLTWKDVVGAPAFCHCDRNPIALWPNKSNSRLKKTETLWDESNSSRIWSKSFFLKRPDRNWFLIDKNLLLFSSSQNWSFLFSDVRDKSELLIILWIE